jgi:hypothetical protein
MGSVTSWKMRRQAEGFPEDVLCYDEMSCSTGNLCELIISVSEEDASLRRTVRDRWRTDAIGMDGPPRRTRLDSIAVAGKDK